MITEAIILAGGKGTRLQSVIKDIPKPMAKIAGRPFITYIFDELSNQGIKHVILSVGYKHEVITKSFGGYYKNMTISYSIETSPLGTGGAIKQALNLCETNDPLILNGDTLFSIDIKSLYNVHSQQKSDLTIALKELTHFDRYGTVKIEHNLITHFVSKKPCKKGLINGGIYLINRSATDLSSLPDSFSFETDFLEKKTSDISMNGYPFDNYFIDIGIPEDYKKAQLDLKQLNTTSLPIIDETWTIFLDRDGVINKKIDNGYVTSFKSFDFLPRAIEAIKKLTACAGEIFIVTNQQCVGKEIISNDDLYFIHDEMLNAIEEQNGSITQIYYAPQLKEEESAYRKPNSGMADLAKEDFPYIDFNKSIVIGDSDSDIQFGLNKGMITIKIEHQNSGVAHFSFPSLFEVVKSICNI